MFSSMKFVGPVRLLKCYILIQTGKMPLFFFSAEFFGGPVRLFKCLSQNGGSAAFLFLILGGSVG